MAQKDPAALFYIGDWLKATKEMPADCRGWYLNLILHQFDKGDLPNDIEELANLADVRFSEFERFKQVFKQVLEQKFEQNDKGRLENAVAKEIIQRRETFKDKRSTAGRIGYFIKYIKRNFSDLGKDLYFLEFVKNNLDIEKIDTQNEQMLKQVLKHLLKLYRNENENIYKTLPVVGKVEEESTESNQGEEKEEPASPKPAAVPHDATDLPENYKLVVNEANLSPKMVARFKQLNPVYPIDHNGDYKQCYEIACKIAEAKGWTQESVTNGNMDACLTEWEAVIQFVKTDDYLSGLDLKRLNSQWGSVILKMNKPKSQKNGTHQQNSSPKSATAIKADAANALLGLAQERIAALAAGATGA
jgi:hypothetical protein